MLIEQNIEKANWLCTGSKSLPANIEDVAPINLFAVQQRDYILPKEIVSVLSAFAMFLYDYFGRSIINE